MATVEVLTFGSLFSGIGGIDLGLERAGMVVRWQVEIDDFCNRVLAKHWPNVARFRDVREVSSHNLEPVDLIAGGFPCQDISIAGKGAGITGAKSGLWAQFARILGELRPRFVLVENVAALLHRGLGVVLGDLAALGYDAEWHCIPAAAVGAPHFRDRVWVVAYAAGRRDLVEQWPARMAEARGAAEVAWPNPPARVGEPDGISDRVDRNRALGNAVVPQVVEMIGRAIISAHHNLARPSGHLASSNPLRR